MPESTPRQLRCPACKAAFSAPCAQEVDAALQPGAKRALLDGSFFQAACPGCGHSIRTVGRLFYRDAAQKLMVHLDPAEARREVFFVEAVPYSKQGYSLRLVSSPEALAETLRIFEDNLSDKVLELWKAVQFARVTREYAGRNVDALRYVQRQGKYMQFDMLAGPRAIARISLPGADYEARFRVLEPFLQQGELPGRYLRVDAGYLETKAGMALCRRLEDNRQ